jgi:hypothetical protein
MKVKSLSVVVVALLALNIFDGSFNDPGLLDWLKLPLFALCFILLFARRGKNGA